VPRGFIRCIKDSRKLVRHGETKGPATIAEQFERYLKGIRHYDFFFITQYTDKTARTAIFAAKKKPIEDVRRRAADLAEEKAGRARRQPAITRRRARLKGHSWHPQPVLIHSATSARTSWKRFTETGANSRFRFRRVPGEFLMRLMQGEPEMFDKFGA